MIIFRFILLTPYFPISASFLSVTCWWVIYRMIDLHQTLWACCCATDFNSDVVFVDWFTDKCSNTVKLVHPASHDSRLLQFIASCGPNKKNSYWSTGKHHNKVVMCFSVVLFITFIETVETRLVRLWKPSCTPLLTSRCLIKMDYCKFSHILNHGNQKNSL